MHIEGSVFVCGELLGLTYLPGTRSTGVPGIHYTRRLSTLSVYIGVNTQVGTTAVF